MLHVCAIGCSVACSCGRLWCCTCMHRRHCAPHHTSAAISKPVQTASLGRLPAGGDCASTQTGKARVLFLLYNCNTTTLWYWSLVFRHIIVQHWLLLITYAIAQPYIALPILTNGVWQQFSSVTSGRCWLYQRTLRWPIKVGEPHVDLCASDRWSSLSYLSHMT